LTWKPRPAVFGWVLELRTHFAYRAEHAVDLATGTVVAVNLASGAAGDTETILETLQLAGENITKVSGVTNPQRAGDFICRWSCVSCRAKALLGPARACQRTRFGLFAESTSRSWRALALESASRTPPNVF